MSPDVTRKNSWWSWSRTHGSAEPAEPWIWDSWRSWRTWRRPVNSGEGRWRPSCQKGGGLKYNIIDIIDIIPYNLSTSNIKFQTIHVIYIHAYIHYITLHYIYITLHYITLIRMCIYRIYIYIYTVYTLPSAMTMPADRAETGIYM